MQPIWRYTSILPFTRVEVIICGYTELKWSQWMHQKQSRAFSFCNMEFCTSVWGLPSMLSASLYTYQKLCTLQFSNEKLLKILHKAIWSLLECSFNFIAPSVCPSLTASLCNLPSLSSKLSSKFSGCNRPFQRSKWTMFLCVQICIWVGLSMCELCVLSHVVFVLWRFAQYKSNPFLLLLSFRNTHGVKKNTFNPFPASRTSYDVIGRVHPLTFLGDVIYPGWFPTFCAFSHAKQCLEINTSGVLSLFLSQILEKL